MATTKTTPQKTARRIDLPRALPYILIIAGAVGIIASFILTNDDFQLLRNPSFQPTCNINPVISCGSVMSSAQGSIFGFPNSIIGLPAFPVLLTIGVSMLAGATFRRWFWRAFEAGMAAGLIFAGWMFFESVYRIRALCPFCLTVDVAVITTFWYLTLYVIGEGHVRVPARLIGVADFARRHHAEVLIVWFLVLLALILQHFWYYYGRVI